MEGGVMSDKKRTLDDNIKDRERLDREYWKRSEKLTDEFEVLMKEPDESE
jgi:hypothetical protein